MKKYTEQSDRTSLYLDNLHSKLLAEICKKTRLSKVEQIRIYIENNVKDLGISKK